MKLGILGPGRIATTVASTLVNMKEIECYCVGSRDLSRAQAFAEKWGFKKAYGSYDEMLTDPELELVYICTPISKHFEDICNCLNHGKHVICEKAFCLNETEAKKVFKLSKEKGLFLAEAIWPRYMPSRKIIDEYINSGIVGDITMLTADLSYRVNYKPRLVDINLGGGALLDIGIYCVNFMLTHYGMDFDHFDTSVQMTGEGIGNVDAQGSITMHYNNGLMAVLSYGMYGRSDRHAVLYGTEGYIVIDNINNPLKITAYNSKDEVIKETAMPNQISGYEYEFSEAVKCINEGKIETDSMPCKDSLELMHMLDAIRNNMGLKFPQE